MQGVACPECGRPVLPFRRYWREVENRRTICCSQCGAKLRPSALFGLCLLATFSFTWLPILSLVLGARPFIVMLAAMTGIAVGSFSVSFIAWLTVPWVAVSR